MPNTGIQWAAVRVTDAQKLTDALKQFEGRKLEVLWIEDSRGELELATLDAIDRNITDEYTLDDGVWYEEWQIDISVGPELCINTPYK